ncbi:MAG: HAD hydrolase-like protein [Lachnospiraceae bacterium]|jgi:phosphoglycolate phosphatase|nr:HAD hydrolase-like protein [Lachnospiraceae bacterium]
MIRFIFWDLDGTIIKSEGGVLSSVRYALDRMGVTIPESEIRKFIGPSLFDSFTNRAHMSPEDADRAIEYYRELYEDTGLFDAAVYDGVPEVMEQLREAGLSHVVVTSKPQHTAERVLEHFGIRQYLGAIVGPTPDDHSSDKEKLIRAALKRFQAEPSEAVMIGDRCFDIDGAAAAGIRSIGVLYGYGSREELEASGADRIAGLPADIPEVLNTLS